MTKPSDVKNYSFKESYLEGETFFMSWEMIDRLVSAVNVFLLLKFLNLYEYGVYHLILAFFGLVIGFMLDGLHGVFFNDLARFLREHKFVLYKKLFSEYATLRFILGLIVWVIIFLFAGWVGNRYGESAGLIRIISFLFLIDGPRKALTAIFKSHLQFGIVASHQPIVSVTKLVLLSVFIYFNILNLDWVIWIHVLSYLSATLVLFILFLDQHRHWYFFPLYIRGSVFWDTIKKYGKWSFASDYVSRFSHNIRPWLIKFLISTEAVAIFNLALSLVGALSSLMPYRSMSALIPRELGDLRRLKSIYLKTTKFFGLFGIASAVAAFFIFPPLVSWLLPRYTVSLPFFKMMALLFLPSAGFAFMTKYILVAFRDQRVLFTRSFFQVGTTVGFALVFIPMFGIWGMAWEYILSAWASALILYHYIMIKYPKLNLGWKEVFTFNRDDYEFIKENTVSVLKSVKNKVFK